jgi:hypothetical protein
MPARSGKESLRSGVASILPERWNADRSGG